jgi:hypothetical protein
MLWLTIAIFGLIAVGITVALLLYEIKRGLRK